MSKYIKTELDLRDACRSAGVWYVGSFMIEYLMRKEEWMDPDRKQEFIKSMHEKYKGIDEDITGTRTRANAMIRIIEAGKVKEALDLVIQSNGRKLGCADSKEYARQLLEKIETGQITV